MEEKKKKVILSLAMIFVLIVVVIGISYAAFTFSKEGNKENSITTGAITMTYTEGNNSISMENAIPMTDEKGKTLVGGDQVFDFTVSMNIIGKFKIAYEVVAEKLEETSTLGNQEVRLYLERSIDATNYTSVMEPTYYVPSKKETSFGAPIGSMIMDTGTVTETTVYYYRLRMWVDEEYQATDVAKSFTVRVNVYGTTEERTLDEEGPRCEFGEYEEKQVGEESKLIMTCIDEEMGVEKKELQPTDFTISDSTIGEIKAITSPTRITNGYQYELTLVGKARGSYTLTLPEGIIQDKVGNGNQAVSKEITVKGLPEQSIQDLDITVEVDNIVYDGTEKKPTVVVKHGDVVLTEGVDYTIDYGNNTNAGEGTITITGTGNINEETGVGYTGTEIKTFTIEKAEPKIELSAASGSVNKGSTTTFTENASIAGTFTHESSNTGVVTISPSNYSDVAANTNKEVTLTGVENGTSTITVTFTPTDTTNYKPVTKTYQVTVYGVATTGSCASRTYTGSSQTLASGGTGVTYSNNSRTNAGSQTVTVTANSGYQFSDGTTSKTLSCSIAKATPTVTLSATSGFVGRSGKNIKISSSVAGNFINTSGATDIVTVSPSKFDNIEANTNNTITVTAVSKGTGIVTVKFIPTDSTNYNTVNKTYEATTSLSVPALSLANVTTSSGSSSITLGDTVTIKIKGTDTDSSLYQWPSSWLSNNLSLCSTCSIKNKNKFRVFIGGTEVKPVRTIKDPGFDPEYLITFDLDGITNTGSLSIIAEGDIVKNVAGTTNVQTSIATGITVTGVPAGKFAAAYTYNATKGASNYCITGLESTCQKTTCYNTRTAGSCPAGTIIRYKVNNTTVVDFHVMEDKGTTMVMQTQKNLKYYDNYTTLWISKEDYMGAGGTGSTQSDKGPLTVLKALESETANWTNVNNQTYALGTTVFKDNAYTSCDISAKNCTDNQYTLPSRTAKARMITVQEALALGCDNSSTNSFKSSCPIWMQNYLGNAPQWGGTNNSLDEGYFTSNVYSNYSVFVVEGWDITGRNVYSHYAGIRPVVVVSK